VQTAIQGGRIGIHLFQRYTSVELDSENHGGTASQMALLSTCKLIFVSLVSMHSFIVRLLRLEI
jgi:hypothetical protein